MTKPATPPATSEFHQSTAVWTAQFQQAGQVAKSDGLSPKFDRETALKIPGRFSEFFKSNPSLVAPLREAGIDDDFFAAIAAIVGQLTKDTAEQLPDLRYWQFYTPAQRQTMVKAGTKVANLRKSISAAATSLRDPSLASLFGIGQEFHRESLSSVRGAIKAMLSGFKKQPDVRVCAGIATAKLDDLRSLDAELATVDTSRFGSATGRAALSKDFATTVLAIENALHVYRARANSAFDEDEASLREALSILPRATERRGAATSVPAQPAAQVPATAQA